MCFSASGSFIVAGVLSVIGVACVKYAIKKTCFLMYALIPLFFAAQQACEGIVWLTVYNSPEGILHQAAALIYLLFAYVLWPFYLPLALWNIETKASIQKALKFFTLLGIAYSTHALVNLIQNPPIASVVSHSIYYTYGSYASWLGRTISMLAYILASTVPFFVSSLRMGKIIGVGLLSSLALTYFVKHATLSSVWCFFAAILSGIILVSIKQEVE